MTVSCLACSNLRLKGVTTAANGFGGCKTLPPYQLVSVMFERDCAAFINADQGVMAKRVEWAGAFGRTAKATA